MFTPTNTMSNHSFPSIYTRWVTSLCPHPTNPSIFLSGGASRGLVSWDMRISKTTSDYFGSFGEVEDIVFLDVFSIVAYTLAPWKQFPLQRRNHQAKLHRSGFDRLGLAHRSPSIQPDLSGRLHMLLCASSPKRGFLHRTKCG